MALLWIPLPEVNDVLISSKIKKLVINIYVNVIFFPKWHRIRVVLKWSNFSSTVWPIVFPRKKTLGLSRCVFWPMGLLFVVKFEDNNWSCRFGDCWSKHEFVIDCRICIYRCVMYVVRFLKESWGNGFLIINK